MYNNLQWKGHRSSVAVMWWSSRNFQSASCALRWHEAPIVHVHKRQVSKFVALGGANVGQKN